MAGCITLAKDFNLPMLPKAAADETFRTKFLTVPKVIHEWTKHQIDFRQARILDFGCGDGVAALGLAINHQPQRVVGIDIMPDPANCLPLARSNLDLEALPGNLFLQQVEPGELSRDDAPFDLIYSWSVFEHVDQRILPGILTRLRNSLKTDGLMLIQIAPLFYSAEGSHLYHKIPLPWGHLEMQESIYYERLAAASSSEEELRALWSLYQTLNKITAAQLKDLVTKAGFRILRTHLTHCSQQPSRDLKSIFHEQVLTTNQIVLLLSR